MVNIKQVGYFVAVFETKSFTAAAHQRNVTVQAISKSISELEQFFNVQFLSVEVAVSGRLRPVAAFMPRLAPPSKHIARLKTLTRLDAT